ncbi:MAG: ABC transporter permease [Desulfobacteraceae bacterium]|nr:MAG: ABC transporter permease [Desulfobacteraceae bacterium]
MLFYIIQRIGLSVLILFLVLLTLFALIHIIPGDPVSIALGPRATPEIEARFIEKMHLDKPWYEQFVVFAVGALKGDLGEDIFTGQKVSDIIFSQLPYTIALALSGLGWAVCIGIPLGCFSASYPNSLLDRMLGVISVGTIAMPSFVVSIYSLLIFAIMLNWFPVIGAGEKGDLIDQLHHLVLPAFAVGLGWVGYLARMVRASMLEVLSENFIRASISFGIPRVKIIYLYALKVAILPTITLIGIGFGGLLSGAVFAEIIFARPGIGKLIYDMVEARNFPVVQGSVLITAFMFIFTMLVTDLIVAYLDPRLRKKL